MTRPAPNLREQRISWSIFFLAVIFALAENSYFGWNWKPGSEAELICDGIVLLLCALAIRR